MNTINQAKNNLKLFIILLVGTIIVAALVIYFGIIGVHSHINPKNVKIDGVYLPIAQDFNNFQLTDNNGQPFTKSDLKGHWTLMFFGFTNCGFVCPTTLSALNKMYRQLQEQLPENQLPQVVMISVDPERDTVKRMNSYVTAFNPHFRGARADGSMTDRLEKEFHIAAAKIQVDGKGKNHYTIDHTAEIIVINPEAKMQAFMSYPHKPEQMVADYKLILSVG